MNSESRGPKHVGALACGLVNRSRFKTERQSGQALPLGIAFILVGFLGAFVLFNTGQVAVDKQRLSDAADSAAYSGMVWQARALNFQAYTNRAMIANDVTIGQAVSLNSWSTYSVIATGNISVVLSSIPIINVFAETVASVFKAVNAVVDPVSKAMVTAMDLINGVIEFSQEAMFASAFLATPDIVNQVAKASDADFEAESAYAIAGLVMNLNSWKDFTEKYEQTDLAAMRERTDMVSQSRDAFATERRWKFIEKFWFFYASPFTQYRVYYDGQTRLLMSEGPDGQPNWEWVAKDGMSLHIKKYRFKRFKLRSRTSQQPIGWASAYANSDGGGTRTIDGSNSGCRSYTTTNADPCGFLRNNSDAERYANIGTPGLNGESSGPNRIGGYKGVNAFRSLSRAVLADADGTGDPVLRLRTEISMDMDTVQSNNDWVHDSEPFATELVSAGKKMSSISIAEVYYRHPKAYRTSRAVIALQKANGYNPYWDVRLAPVDVEERLVALALREGLVGGSSGSSAPGSVQLGNYGGGDDGLDLEPAGNVSELGDYVATLAESMSIDETLNNGVMSGVDRFTQEGFSAAALDVLEADYELEDIAERIGDTLKDALEDAMKALLMEGITNTLGIDEGDIKQAEIDAEGIENLAVGIKEKMEKIQDAVAADFDEVIIREVPVFEAQVASINALITPLQIEVNRLNEDINGRDRASDGPVAQRDRVQGQIDGYRQQISDAAVVLKGLVINTVIDSMMRHGSEFFTNGITGEFREYLEEDITAMLYEYLSMSDEERNATETEGLLPWEVEEDEVEDTYNEDDYGNFED